MTRRLGKKLRHELLAIYLRTVQLRSRSFWRRKLKPRLSLGLLLTACLVFGPGVACQKKAPVAVYQKYPKTAKLVSCEELNERFETELRKSPEAFEMALYDKFNPHDIAKLVKCMKDTLKAFD